MFISWKIYLCSEELGHLLLNTKCQQEVIWTTPLDLTLVTLKGQVKDKVIDFNLCILEHVAHKLLLSTADYTFHGIDIPWVDDLSLH